MVSPPKIKDGGCLIEFSVGEAFLFKKFTMVQEVALRVEKMNIENYLLIILAIDLILLFSSGMCEDLMKKKVYRKLRKAKNDQHSLL